MAYSIQIYGAALMDSRLKYVASLRCVPQKQSDGSKSTELEKLHISFLIKVTITEVCCIIMIYCKSRAMASKVRN
jgi:hypothetical protein